MTAVAGTGRSLLSICIPTYNRATCLAHLLETLLPLKARYADEIQVCVSDNASPDETAQVIARYAGALDIKLITQASNIGGTLNILEVVSMFDGQWGLLVGDDDDLNPAGLEALLSYLRTAAPETWLMAEAADLDGNGRYFADFPDYPLTREEGLHLLASKGLDNFGFMGCYVIPSSARATCERMKLVDAKPWPHIAALLRRLAEAEMTLLFFPHTVVQQARAGEQLFWEAGGQALIHLAKLTVISRAYRYCPRYFGFHIRLMLKEAYAYRSLVSTLLWKLYEPQNFRRLALREHISVYRQTGRFFPLLLPHALLLSTLLLIPGRLYEAMFKVIGKHHLYQKYRGDKQRLSAFDANKRGL